MINVVDGIASDETKESAEVIETLCADETRINSLWEIPLLNSQLLTRNQKKPPSNVILTEPF
jgi:hypothetical protein